MSVMALAWAEDLELPPVLKLIMIGLAESAGGGDDEGEGLFGVARMARFCGLPGTEFLALCADLEERGLLRLDPELNRQGLQPFEFPSMPGRRSWASRPRDPRELVRQRFAGLSSKARAAIREKLAEQHGASCRHCGTTESLEIDHILPVQRGGSNDLLNLQLLCTTCNVRKGARFEG